MSEQTVTKSELIQATVAADESYKAVSAVEDHVATHAPRGPVTYWYSNKNQDTDTDNERVYLGLLNHSVEVYKSSYRAKGDRTGTGTYSDFGPQCIYDLRKGFPLLTTKAMRFKSIWIELIWFLKGDTNLQFLHKYGVNIWNEWADENGNLGPVYGKMWRDWSGVDQIGNLLKLLVTDPDSRRMIVTGWDPTTVPNPRKSFTENIANGKQALPPCHTMWQVYTSLIPVDVVISNLRLHPQVTDSCIPLDNGDDAVYEYAKSYGVPTRYLDLKLYQRSGDVFLGVPYNIASYSALMLILCSITGYAPRYFIHTFGDVHLYSNHVDQAIQQLSRTPKSSPTLELVYNQDRSGVGLEHLLSNPETTMSLINYEPHPAIAAPVAV